MNLSRITLQTAFVASLGLAFQPAPRAQEGLQFKGDVQLQGEKSFARGWGGDNLDDLWGRLNFGAEYKDSSFESKFNIRIFPEGFGFEPVVGASYDTTGAGAVKVATSAQSRTSINHAWVRQNFADFSVRVGRFETRTQPSFFFGNYIDLAPGGKFDGRNAVHNATEITSKYGGISSSVLLGTSDKHMDKGFIRIYERVEVSEQLALALGFRSNIFDKVYSQDAEILNRLDGSLHFATDAKRGVLIEAAMLQLANVADQFPVLVSAYSSLGVIDRVAIEAEYLADRMAQGEDKSVLINLYLAQNMFKRARFDVGIYSDAASKEFIDMGVGIRFTCGLK